jgi:hypothetical protein
MNFSTVEQNQKKFHSCDTLKNMLYSGVKQKDKKLHFFSGRVQDRKP